jgi:hypothetical protein
MSILNLNTPQGRGPVGKKSAKIWMGVGLLAAVLGFGSTFAANITLNSPGGTTEFGQGVSQTVYCGGDTSVTITPISTYSNTVVGSPTGGSAEDSFTARFANSYSSSYSDFEQYSGSTSTVNGKTGWWLTNTGTKTLASNQALSNVKANASNYVFTERTSRSGDYGYYKVNTTRTEKVVITPAVAPTPGATTPASFKVGGVLISDIPSACAGVNFVISAYGETGSTATTLISSGATNIKEVAVNWTRVPGSAVASIDRTAFVSSALVSATQTLTTLKISFDTSVGTPLSANALYKLVVETQEDAIA